MISYVSLICLVVSFLYSCTIVHTSYEFYSFFLFAFAFRDGGERWLGWGWHWWVGEWFFFTFVLAESAWCVAAAHQVSGTSVRDRVFFEGERMFVCDRAGRGLLL